MRDLRALLGTFFAVTVLALALPPSVDGQVTREDRHARHILVETEAEADALIKRIEGGESFVKLCRKYSKDTVTKRVGGDLQYVRGPGSWPGIDEVYKVKEINGVIKGRTQYGWHVIQYLGSKTVTLSKTKGKPKPKPKAQPEKKPETKPATQPAKKEEKPAVIKKEPADKSATGKSAADRRKELAKLRRNKDVTVNFELEKSGCKPGEDIYFTIEMTNNTKKVLNVFSPDIWPLGVSGRFQGRSDGDKHLALKSLEMPADGLFYDLDGGKTLKRRYRLQEFADNLASWPTIRVRWKGKDFFKNLEAQFPSLTEHNDFETWKISWSRYGSSYSPLSILPDFKNGGTWHMRFFFGRSAHGVWVELKDPGIPGLMDYWLDLVRQNKLVRQPFSDKKLGDYLYAESKGSDAQPFPVTGGKRAKPGPYELAIALDNNVAGPGFVFTLGKPTVDASRAISIGSVVSNEAHLDSMAQPGDGGRLLQPVVAYVELFPEAVIPESLMAQIRRTGATTREAKPDTKTPVKEQPTTRNKTTTQARIPATKRPQVVMHVGDDVVLKIELYEDEVPNTVKNFITLVQDEYYTGKEFYLRSENELNKGWIQAGSPDSSELGKLDFTIKNEFHRKLSHQRGTIGLATRRDGTPDSGSCQFFVNFDNQPQLNEQFPVFGKVIEGLEDLEKMPIPAKIRRCVIVPNSLRNHDYKPVRTPLGQK